MIPPHLAEDLIRRANIAMWTPGDPSEQAKEVLATLYELIKVYGRARFTDMSGVETVSFGPRTSKCQAQLRTVLKILPYLNLRARIERDPNPRHPWRPMSKRALFQERLVKLRLKDPSGKLAQEAIDNDKARRASAVKAVQKHYARFGRKKYK